MNRRAACVLLFLSVWMRQVLAASLAGDLDTDHARDTDPAGGATRAGAADSLAASAGQACTRLPSPVRISSIRIERADVFDSELFQDDQAIYRLGNALHLKTRESVIRREVLYAPGEELDTLRVLETERNLRALGFLGDADTRLDFNDDSTQVQIVLTTSDLWSTIPDPIIPEGGDDYAAGLELEEQNLFGLGKEVTAEYYAGRSVGERYAGYGGSYYDRDVLWTRHRFYLDGRFDGFIRRWTGWIALPQRSLRDRYSYRVSAASTSGTQRRIESGEVLFRYGHETRRLGAAFTKYWDTAVPSGAHRTLSMTLGLSGSRQASRLRAEDEEYRDRVTADRTRTSLEWDASLSLRRYATTRLLENFGNVEDLSLGAWCGLGAATAVDLFGSDSRLRTAEAWASGRHRPRPNVLLSEHVSVSTGAGDDGVPLTYACRVTALVAAPQRWVTALRLRGSLLRHPPAYSVAYLGGRNGLRGYGPYDLSGQNYVLCNFEERYFSPLRIYTVCFGGAGFLDFGKTWTGDSGFGDADWAGDVGLSVLLGLSKMPERQVVRYDLAWRVTEPGFRWSVGYGMYFGN